MNKAIFLDRDGIINKDKGYVFKYEDIEWMPGIFDIISFANTNNYLVFVLTNQSGVSRGKYSENDVINLHTQMDKFLHSNGLIITEWLYCLDFDEIRRKPGPGMMLEAASKHKINLVESIMIGDKVSDVLNVSGPQYFLVQGNYPLIDVLNRSCVKIFPDLATVLKALQNE